MISHLRTWFDGASSLAQAVAGLGLLIALLAVAFVLWRCARAMRGAKPENVLTVVAAAMATSVASTGMWHFFERTMQLPAWLRAVLFAFMEVAVLAEALRARANVKATGEAGLDGRAVWVLTILSGSMSATEAGSVRASVVRFTSPLVAAWLWERSLVPERRAARQQRTETVRWIFDVKRIAVRLGLATALDSNIESADANTRINKAMRAKEGAEAAGWLTRRWRARQAARSKARLLEQAMQYADPLPLLEHLGGRAILKALVYLGGEDAVVSGEKAAEMSEVLRNRTRSGVGGPAPDEAPPASDAEAGEETETGVGDPGAAAWIPEQRPAGASGVSGGLRVEPVAAPAAADDEQIADVDGASPEALPIDAGGQRPVLPGSVGEREAVGDPVLPGRPDGAGGADSEQGSGGGEAADTERANGRRRASSGKVRSEQVLTALVELASSGQSNLPSARQIHRIVGGRWETVTSVIDDLGGIENAWEQALTQVREPVPAER